MDEEHRELILRHYRGQALKHGASAASTMEDEIVREKEVLYIEAFLDAVRASDRLERVLEVGCGNGYLQGVLAAKYPEIQRVATDLSMDMLSIASGRAEASAVLAADAQLLPFGDGCFDVVVTERCLINILTWKGQSLALESIGATLKPGGYLLLIEAFQDGLESNNLARSQCGLEPIDPAYHNLYLVKDRVVQTTAATFRLVSPEELSSDGALAGNFLSSHYFVARVLHPLVTKGDWVRNTEFVRFFSAFLPPVGNYSPIQALILKRR